MEQRTPEWHDARRGRITASIVGAILGHSPNMTRDGAMRRMVRDWLGAESEFTGNIATEYGTFNEPGACAEYVMETGNHVDHVGFIVAQDGDWAGCSPDGLIGEDGGLEIKCPFGKRKDAAPEFKSLEEQPHYLDQVQFSLWVTGRAWWDFYQWAAGGTSLVRVFPDAAWQEKNIPSLRDFHAEFLRIVNDDDLSAPFLEPERASYDTPKAHMMVSEYDQLCEAIDNAEARKKEIIQDLVEMAGSKNAIVAGRNLTLVRRSGSISYAKALKAIAPDADLEPYRGKPSESWVLK